MIKKIILKSSLFIILSIIVVISQIILLKPHLQYGFSDVDWGFLSIYKTENPYSPSQFIEFLKRGGTLGGVYTHQIYYIGIQEHFFGLDFKSFHLTTHFFKILATLSSYPLLLAISGSGLVAFIGTILFGFSYSGVGTMYTVVTSNDYLAIFLMNIFLTIYGYIVKKNIGNWFYLLSLLIFLVLALFWSTERIYPLPLFVVLVELFMFWTKKKLEKNSLKRIFVLFSPLIVIFVIKPTIFLSFVLDHGVEIVQRVSLGNWNLTLTPFIALGSIIVPHNYTKYFGIIKMDSFLSFLEFLLFGPIFIFTIVVLILGLTIFKRPLKIILHILLITSMFSVILYILASHFVDHLITQESIIQASVGFYILAIAIVSFNYWRKEKERILLGLFVGPFSAFLYIFLTWVGAATSEVFAGVHRYLTIPALFMSLFLANLFGIIFLKLWKLPQNIKYLKILSVAPLLLLILFININVKEIQYFFKYQLISGFDSSDKQIMRSQLLNYLNNLSVDKPSLIYFDFTDDNDNGYYYDNTLLGGFGSWILWHKKINFNKNLIPITFWNNIPLLESSYFEKEGRIGFLYNKVFFEMKDFYAFKLKDKKIIDIKSEILNQLGVY